MAQRNLDEEDVRVEQKITDSSEQSHLACNSVEAIEIAI